MRSATIRNALWVEFPPGRLLVNLDQCGQMDLAAKYHACMDRAVADAVAKVNRPLLSQYHQLHSNGDKSALVRLARAT